MASIHFHPLVQTASGRYGRMFLRHYASGKVIMALPPSKPAGPPTPAVARQRALFRDAATYGKLIFGHPARRAPYQAIADAGRKQVFAAIMTDLVSRPLVRTVDITSYHGLVGEPIDIHTRNELVATVDIVLRRAGDAELESGGTTLHGGIWRYLGTTAIAAGTDVTVEVSVTDISGLELVTRRRIVIA